MYPRGRNSFHRAGQFTASKFDLAEFMTTVTLKRANFQVLHDSRKFLLAACRGYFRVTPPKRNLRPNEFTSDGVLIRCTTRSMKGLLRGVARCRPRKAKKSTEEKSRKSGAAVGAFIAYGSAKHLWNNGAAKYIVGEEKRKYLARERTRKIGFYCSLPACRSFICTCGTHTR
ncbi:hypothetical protein ALC62_00255 [Cyphomyrmex costatus]|uniref:Uncharacterized protein n=1 Tax=Cyphomyrmex costatus TaxID=456900 RepID=A0A195D8P0_9HYME|nr:hypothetical protein ALC62_00255 [Cyphomyrmex costatus]